MLPDELTKEITARMISEQAKRFMNEISAIKRIVLWNEGSLTDEYTYNPICKKSFINELKTRRNDMDIWQDYFNPQTYATYYPSKELQDKVRRLEHDNDRLRVQLYDSEHELRMKTRRIIDLEKSYKNMKIKKAHFNAPYTIVIWEDKTKTMVKCGENDIYDPEKGLAMCIAKKLYGKNESKSNYYEVFKKHIPKEIAELHRVKNVVVITKEEG